MNRSLDNLELVRERDPDLTAEQYDSEVTIIPRDRAKKSASCSAFFICGLEIFIHEPRAVLMQ